MSDTPIIVIKKRAAHAHGHHGGAWKVAYADFVTAMMAFFLVMWIIGQDKSMKEAIAAYFRDPGVFETARANGLMPGQNGSPAEIPRDVPSLEQAAVQIRHALESMPKFAEIADRIKIEMTADGLRIELLDRAKDSFFDSGSAELKPQMIGVLRVIGQEIGKSPNKITVDGHSDGQGYKASTFYDNWTLSADRANAARRVMEASGLHADQVDAVRGYADRQLRYPKEPLDPRNRRIAIVVKPGRS